MYLLPSIPFRSFGLKYSKSLEYSRIRKIWNICEPLCCCVQYCCSNNYCCCYMWTLNNTPPILYLFYYCIYLSCILSIYIHIYFLKTIFWNFIFSNIQIVMIIRTKKNSQNTKKNYNLGKHLLHAKPSRNILLKLHSEYTSITDELESVCHMISSPTVSLPSNKSKYLILLYRY